MVQKFICTGHFQLGAYYMEMGQEDLLALTENVINEYLQEGSIEGLS